MGRRAKKKHQPNQSVLHEFIKCFGTIYHYLLLILYYWWYFNIASLASFRIENYLAIFHGFLIAEKRFGRMKIEWNMKKPHQANKIHMHGIEWQNTRANLNERSSTRTFETVYLQIVCSILDYTLCFFYSVIGYLFIHKWMVQYFP